MDPAESATETTATPDQDHPARKTAARARAEIDASVQARADARRKVDAVHVAKVAAEQAERDVLLIEERAAEIARRAVAEAFELERELSMESARLESLSNPVQAKAQEAEDLVERARLALEAATAEREQAKIDLEDKEKAEGKAKEHLSAMKTALEAAEKTATEACRDTVLKEAKDAEASAWAEDAHGKAAAANRESMQALADLDTRVAVDNQAAGDVKAAWEELGKREEAKTEAENLLAQRKKDVEDATEAAKKAEEEADRVRAEAKGKTAALKREAAKKAMEAADLYEVLEEKQNAVEAASAALKEAEERVLQGKSEVDAAEAASKKAGEEKEAAEEALAKATKAAEEARAQAEEKQAQADAAKADLEKATQAERQATGPAMEAAKGNAAQATASLNDATRAKDQAVARLEAAVPAVSDAEAVLKRATADAITIRQQADEALDKALGAAERARLAQTEVAETQAMAQAAIEQAKATRAKLDAEVEKNIKATAKMKRITVEEAEAKKPAKKKKEAPLRAHGYVVMEVDGEKMFHRLPTYYQVGKSADCELVIAGWRAPRKAAIIVRGVDPKTDLYTYTLLNVAPKAEVVLLNSKNMKTHATLKHGDTIEVCKTVLRFEKRGERKAVPQQGPSALPR